MKRTIVALAVLLSALPGFPAAEAPTQVNINIQAEIPGFMAGPIVEFVTLPIGIGIGKGMSNYLGWGACGGVMVGFPDGFTVMFPLQGVFVGRFGFVKNFPIDWDVKLGVGLVLEQGPVLYGQTDIGIQFPLAKGKRTGRAAAGITFRPAPYDPSSFQQGWIVSFMLNAGLVLPLRGFKSWISM
ncbi:MAG: hypothetical protein NT005_06330 [Spirochaetes bacterium]|nr:hypothetical protein [Spirochaetota bacterium]